MTRHPASTPRNGLDRNSPFSYDCQACQRCCQHKLIRINPFEALRLARCLGLSTTAFLARHVERERSVLYQDDDGRCRFLDPVRGCTVHADRPLVCRLYPLGRHRSSQGIETFSSLAPHPQSEGRWGEAGTVATFLDAQQVQPYVHATDRLIQRFDALRWALEAVDDPDEADEAGDAPALDWLDIDAVLAHFEVPHGADGEAGLAHDFEAYLKVLADQASLRGG